MKTSSSRGSGSGNSARQGPGLSEPQITTTRCPRAGLQLQRGEEEGCRGWAPSEWRWGLRKAGRVYFKQAPIAGTLTQCIPNSQTLNPKATILTLHQAHCNPSGIDLVVAAVQLPSVPQLPWSTPKMKVVLFKLPSSKGSSEGSIRCLYGCTV